MYKLIAFVAGLLLFPSFAHAALLYIDPAEAEYGLGDMFMVNVRLDNEGECVNAVEATVTYSTDTLQAVDFSRGRSIMALWVEEPVIDTERGVVTFSGGMPGGYCGRIQGDPALSNIVGTIVFSAIRGEGDAAVSVSPSSQVYLSDGQGTKAELSVQSAAYSLLPYPVLPENEWLKAVGDDTVPPDAFDVIVESTRGVFGGRYYIVFSTVDKQSGIDHYEIFERNVWKTISSPYHLADQTLRGGIQVKAIDKAGNERLGTYIEGSAPPRVAPSYDVYIIVGAIALLVLVGFVKLFIDRRKNAEMPPAA